MAFYTNCFIYKNNVYYRGIRNDKIRIQRTHEYAPYMFVQSSEGTFRTIEGIPVKKKNFKSITDARNFIKKCKEYANMKVYGLSNFEYTFLNDLFPKEVEYDPSLLHIGNIDIEAFSLNTIDTPEPIISITMKSNLNDSIHVFGCGIFQTENEDDIYFHRCNNEKEMLLSFLEYWETLNLDIITGYNLRLYDIPYLVNRIKMMLGEIQAQRMSPWRWIEPKIISLYNKDNNYYELKGISILDYYELYKKFTFKNHESYRLDYIGKEELEEGKVDYNEYNTLQELYKNDYQKFIEYNIRDVELVDKLEKKLGFIDLVIAMAYEAKCNFNDVMATIKPWDIIIHNYLLERNIVIPPLEEITNEKSIIGGYVKESASGFSNWVVSFDLTSLYPFIMQMWNISPDTYLEINHNISYEIKNNKVLLKNPPEEKNCTITANGCKYRNNKQGFMAALMEDKFKKRAVYKQKMIKAKQKGNKLETTRYYNKQLSQKIFLNSLYGSLLNPFSRWFSFENGEAITTTGRAIITFIEMVLNNFFNDYLKTNNIDYIKAMDTDSCYICLEEFVNQSGEQDQQKITDLLINFCEKKISPYMDKCFKQFAEETRALDQKLNLKLEKITNKAIFTTKKHYALNVLYDEGVFYKEPHLEIKGLEAVKSSTPQICREWLKKCLKIIMNEDQETLINVVEDFKVEFMEMPFEMIASPRSVNGLEKYKNKKEIYKAVSPKGKPNHKGSIPIHVRAALVFNYFLEKYDIKNIQPIQNGDKIKFCYLILPNPVFENVIASFGILPKEFGLEEYIDYELQFEKVFLDPLKSITNVIDWEVEYKSSLTRFYV